MASEDRLRKLFLMKDLKEATEQLLRTKYWRVTLSFLELGSRWIYQDFTTQCMDMAKQSFLSHMPRLEMIEDLTWLRRLTLFTFLEKKSRNSQNCEQKELIFHCKFQKGWLKICLLKHKSRFKRAKKGSK